MKVAADFPIFAFGNKEESYFLNFWSFVKNILRWAISNNKIELKKKKERWTIVIRHAHFI